MVGPSDARRVSTEGAKKYLAVRHNNAADNVAWGEYRPVCWARQSSSREGNQHIQGGTKGRKERVRGRWRCVRTASSLARVTGGPSHPGTAL